MKRRVAGRVAKPRICAGCKGPISEQRPVFLVATRAGTIVGPYHAGCAERIVLAKAHPESMPGTDGATNYGTWPTPREETLPW